MKTSIDKKRLKKVLRRRKLKAHKNRVGPDAYYGDRIEITCATCGEKRKLNQMLQVAGGFGMGQCKACLIKLGEIGNEENTSI